ncbi:hypothetical protein [Pseudanabaena sp. FACHB-2040]|uniref:hypothetical protein n=1 Tax=Pseudanabaena sp. FACHB-2040 TaxID=2692859 RepID=UPI001684E053|nr:hypothetical protein [Pseudanabaena sp. FACHB-2040]MBD2256668.1 hypothetical protein [Pseudanabaena sp. FACHB-2040]
MARKKAKQVRYSQQIVDRVCRLVKEGAADDEVIIIIGCSKSTYYRWYKDHPEFAAAVAEARKGWEGTQDVEVNRVVDKLAQRRLQAEAWIDQVLTGTAYKVKQTLGAQGVVIKEERESIIPDKWLLDRVLGSTEPEQKFELIIGLADPDSEDDNAAE